MKNNNIHTHIILIWLSNSLHMLFSCNYLINISIKYKYFYIFKNLNFALKDAKSIELNIPKTQRLLFLLILFLTKARSLNQKGIRENGSPP